MFLSYGVQLCIVSGSGWQEISGREEDWAVFPHPSLLASPLFPSLTLAMSRPWKIQDATQFLKPRKKDREEGRKKEVREKGREESKKGRKKRGNKEGKNKNFHLKVKLWEF